MRDYVLTPQADARLDDIFSYSFETFGEAQALAYRNAILLRLEALAAGRPPHGRPCAALIGADAPEGFLYVREGGHFIVFVETEERITIIDFVHQKRDLPAHITRLTRLDNES